MTQENHLTTDQLADRWQMSSGTLRNWRQNKKGPKWIKMGKGKRAPVRYRMNDVLDYEQQAGAGA